MKILNNRQQFCETQFLYKEGGEKRALSAEEKKYVDKVCDRETERTGFLAGTRAGLANMRENFCRWDYGMAIKTGQPGVKNGLARERLSEIHSPEELEILYSLGIKDIVLLESIYHLPLKAVPSPAGENYFHYVQVSSGEELPLDFFDDLDFLNVLGLKDKDSHIERFQARLESGEELSIRDYIEQVAT